MSNITTASFAGGRVVAAGPLYQWDYGQVLQFQGLELPAAYEVHFANNRKSGTSYTVLGDADGVAIPDELLTTGKSVYAWIYLHTGEDDGETVYQVVIPVVPRPEPSNGTPTPVQQDVITQTIAALNAAVAEAEAAAAHGPQIVDGYWYIWDSESGENVSTGVEARGSQGPTGPTGPGVASGGTTGQVLKKKSSTDYDTEWVDENYDDLTNKPSIEGVTLSGNKTAADLGLAKASEIPSVPVQSVNGKTGAVVLDADDVGAATEEDVLAAYPTPTVSSAMATFSDGADGLPVKALTVEIAYNENGLTGLTLTRAGKNLADATRLLTLSSTITRDGETYTFPREINGKAYIFKCPLGASGQYILTYDVRHDNAANGDRAAIRFDNTDGTYTRNISTTASPETWRSVSVVSASAKTPIGARYAYLYSSGPSYLRNIQVERGTAASEFEPYTGETFTVDWAAVAGTIYGGSLNLTTGALTSTLASDGTELAEPVTYQLEPVEITTLLGVNNIWADTGDVSVTYRADPTLYGGSGTSAVTSVNGQTGAVVLDASDVGALPDDTTIPSKTSDLTNDSGFITSAPVSSVNGQTGAVVLDADDVGAVASDQGTANAGKFLAVGSDGVVVPVTMATWQGGSY